LFQTLNNCVKMPAVAQPRGSQKGYIATSNFGFYVVAILFGIVLPA